MMSKIEENTKVKLHKNTTKNNTTKNNTTKNNTANNNTINSNTINSNTTNNNTTNNNTINSNLSNSNTINNKLLIDNNSKINGLNTIDNSNKLKIIENLEKKKVTNYNEIMNVENIDYNDLEYRILSMNINGMKNLFNIIKKNNEKFTLKKEHILINLNKLKKNTLQDIYNLLNFYEQQESKIDSIERNLKNLKK